MTLRSTLWQLAAERGLSADAGRRLLALAGLQAEPPRLLERLPVVLGSVAAALGGFGLILWVAANWAAFSRAGRFGLLEAVVAVTGLAAWLRPAARAPFALMAFLGIGALFALFGQTYQTGADPWQLFALWAALGLPLCLGARSDIVWTPWALVTMTAISLWGLAHRERGGFGQPDHALGIELTCWLLSLALVGALSRAFARFTGAGVWALRAAITLAVVPVGFSALQGVFGPHVEAVYPAGLLVLAAAAGLLSQRRSFDLYALCIVTLAIDVLLIGGVASLLGHSLRHEWIGGMLLLTAVSVGLLSVSVKWVLHVARRHAAAAAPAGVAA